MWHKRVADLEDIVAALFFAHWRNQRVPVRPVVVATLIRAALVHGVQRTSSALGVLPVLHHPVRRKRLSHCAEKHSERIPLDAPEANARYQLSLRRGNPSGRGAGSCSLCADLAPDRPSRSQTRALLPVAPFGTSR